MFCPAWGTEEPFSFPSRRACGLPRHLGHLPRLRRAVGGGSGGAQGKAMTVVTFSQVGRPRRGSPCSPEHRLHIMAPVTALVFLVGEVLEG